MNVNSNLTLRLKPKNQIQDFNCWAINNNLENTVRLLQNLILGLYGHAPEPCSMLKNLNVKAPRIHLFLTAEPSYGYKVPTFGLNKASALNRPSIAIKIIHRLQWMQETM